MTANEFRRLALSFPETEERPHGPPGLPRGWKDLRYSRLP